MLNPAQSINQSINQWWTLCCIFWLFNCIRFLDCCALTTVAFRMSSNEIGTTRVLQFNIFLIFVSCVFAIVVCTIWRNVSRFSVIIHRVDKECNVLQKFLGQSLEAYHFLCSNCAMWTFCFRLISQMAPLGGFILEHWRFSFSCYSHRCQQAQVGQLS